MNSRSTCRTAIILACCCHRRASLCLITIVISYLTFLILTKVNIFPCLLTTCSFQSIVPASRFLSWCRGRRLWYILALLVLPTAVFVLTLFVSLGAPVMMFVVFMVVMVAITPVMVVTTIAAIMALVRVTRSGFHRPSSIA